MTTTGKAKDVRKTPARKVSKKDRVLELLRREGGASVSDITGLTNWLPHTSRAMLTGLRKAGFDIAKVKVGGCIRYFVRQSQ